MNYNELQMLFTECRRLNITTMGELASYLENHKINAKELILGVRRYYYNGNKFCVPMLLTYGGRNK